MRAVLLLAVLPPLVGLARTEDAPERPPNVVLVFTDDQGYADVGCYGAQGFETPHLDALAAAGMRFTDFHVSQAVCSASRASLLTGCYAERVGIQGALNPFARIGLNPEEETLAELLREAGYATAAIGKWHLGHHPQFLPTQQGFDEYLGLPYSNDMWPVGYDGVSLEDGVRKSGMPALRLIEGDAPGAEIATLADQAGLTERYTERALDFIERNRERPFFLYLAHSMPHVPLGRPLAFDGRSEQGPYGDVIEEIDASLGRILDALDAHGLREDTLVVFTSDNGPWLNYGDHAGSAGPLREGKGTSWEGGTRVPCIVRWPGRVPAGSVCDALAATLDLLPTICAASGAPLPERTIDGVDLTELLEGRADARPRRSLCYYYGGDLNAVRRDRWKLVFPHQYRSYLGVEPGVDGFPGPYGSGTCGLELYDLAADIGETRDVAAEHPEVVRELQELAARARAELGDGLTDVRGEGVRRPGRLPPRRASPVAHLARDKPVRLSGEPSARYAADGAASLVDGVLGSEDFSDGTWLGYQGRDLEVVVDLGEPLPVERVACSFLRVQGAWIFFPRAIEFATSLDGEQFTPISRVDPEVEPNPEPHAMSFESLPGGREARFVRVRVQGIGPCPEWHEAAGGDAWFFVDELVVE